MELENIVANTIYIKARAGEGKSNKGRSKKWREILKLPDICNVCDIRDEISLTYDYVVLEQPIGQKLFKQFCSYNNLYNNLNKFLEEIDEFELGENNEGLLINIKNKYFDNNSINYINIDKINDSFSNINILTTQTQTTTPATTTTTNNELDICICKVNEFLSDQPFNEFLQSVYFERYLQFKSLEKNLSITKNTFRMYRILGKGGFGEVCACQSKATGRMFACKRIEKKRVKKKKAELMVLNEKLLLQKVNSRFIVNLAYAFETKDSLCLILTLMNGGDLKFHIYNIGVDETKAIFYAAEIACGLNHLHKNNIVYRDLKPENILLDDNGHIRISDLGLAIELHDDQFVKDKVGTCGYMCPEVIKGEPHRFSPDWWGYGCIVYEMIEGRSPFRYPKERVKREEIDKRAIEMKETYSDKFNEDTKSFCSLLLNKDPNQRLGCINGFEEVRIHAFFKKTNWKRIERGVEKPPFVPNPNAVYARDVLDIEQFSTVKGVTINEEDTSFYKRFNTGCVSIPFQNELIETGCFDEINSFNNDDENNNNNGKRDLKKSKQEKYHYNGDNNNGDSDNKHCFNFTKFFKGCC